MHLGIFGSASVWFRLLLEYSVPTGRRAIHRKQTEPHRLVANAGLLLPATLSPEKSEVNPVFGPEIGL